MREGVYVISVASRILDMHPQTLRKYERVGLVLPSRIRRRSNRLYSDEDIARLRLIKHLVDDLGLNLAGVQMALKMYDRMTQMRAQTTQLEGQPMRDAINEGLDDMFEILTG